MPTNGRGWKEGFVAEADYGIRQQFMPQQPQQPQPHFQDMAFQQLIQHQNLQQNLQQNMQNQLPQDDMSMLDLLQTPPTESLDQSYMAALQLGNGQELMTPEGNMLLVEQHEANSQDPQTVFLHEVRFVNGGLPTQQHVLFPQAQFQMNATMNQLAPSALPFSQASLQHGTGGGVST
eukprot:TRINITY_DN6066_c0_g7_i1.p1 TRINITY_DN6066_c0_g7~~TRINITY_DN6066_c0_g7_i1.p1  ORF type:complete len:177 (+),score=49.54 TRINITY_DN6066_c0_g7_i1:3-533(+)